LDPGAAAGCSAGRAYSCGDQGLTAGWLVGRLPWSGTFWRLLLDSGAPAMEVLGLDAGRLDLARHRTRLRPGFTGGDPADLQWQDGTSQVLRWLLAGRTWGPVFLTGRRAPAGTPADDVCRVTGQGRMSYRRAAEILSRRRNHWTRQAAAGHCTS